MREDLLRGQIAVARIEEAIDLVRDEPGRRQTEEVRAVALVRELLQRAVETDRVMGVVVGRRFDREDADQGEDDEARDVAGDSGTTTPLLRDRAHSTRPLVLECAREPAVEVPQADADQHRSRYP